MSLAIIIPFYNDFKALQRLLLHIKITNIPLILCDGRFHQFKKINDSDLSTDGSRFLVHGFKNTKLIDSGACSIEEKLNSLFHEVAKNGHSHALLLGCDEYPIGDLNLLQKNLEKFKQTEPMLIRVPFIEHKERMEKPNYFIERIFYMPDQIKARGSFWKFYSKADETKGIQKPMQSHPSCVLGITIHHDNKIREKERNDLMNEYQMRIKENRF